MSRLDPCSRLILHPVSISSDFQQDLFDRGMEACHNLIFCMLVIRVSGNFWMMGSVIIPENQGCRRVLVVIAVAQPPELSCHEDDGFADFQ